jgi:O-antigen ligase
MVSNLIVNRIARLLIFVGPITTLAISPMVSFDPINPVKTLVVSAISFSILMLMIRMSKDLSKQVGKPLLLVTLMFVIALLSAMFTSGANLSEQFWGTFGRNNGFLSYFSLVVLFLATVFTGNQETYRLILRSLQIASVPMTIYCLIQIAKLDPFPWSAFAAFGTLGNINFLSAFFGLSCLASSHFLLIDKSSAIRIGTSILILTDLGIILQTESIQGLMIFAAGIAIWVLLILIRKSKVIAFSYTLSLFFLFALVLQSFLNKGPLAKFIYQPSITYRGDYMAAGWNMALSHPITGVGLDSYGDWYRAERGVLAAYRTSYGRTSNVAHNVYIDMAASGGFPLLLSFISLNVLIMIYAIRALRRVQFQDNLLIIFSVIWIAFQIQSLVSIAQIGVTIWGWLFSGTLYGYSRLLIKRDSSDSAPSKAKAKPKKVTLDAASSTLSFIGFCLGFTLAFLPFKLDADYRGFSQRGDLNGMVSVTRNPVTSVYFYTHAQYLALTNNYSDIAYELNSRLRLKFPREISGWLNLRTIPNSTPAERELADRSIKALDPYFHCIEPNFQDLIARDIFSLPQSMQRELAYAWGVEKAVYERPDFKIRNLGVEFLTQKFTGFCA